MHAENDWQAFSYKHSMLFHRLLIYGSVDTKSMNKQGPPVYLNWWKN